VGLVEGIPFRSLSLALLVFHGSEAGSQVQPDPLKQLTLEELANLEVVTASKEPEELRTLPAAVYVLTQDDIRRSGATSIPEALRLVPGVEVARIDANKWAIGIRGFGTRLSRSLLVLIDGRSVYTTLFAGVYWDAQDTLMEDIDRIEVIRGPGGTIWGPNAVNGVINIITRNARDTQGVLASASVGNVERLLGGVRYGGSSGELAYRAYGKGFLRQNEFHVDGNEFDDWEMAQAGFRMDANADRDTWSLQGDIYSGDAGNRLAVSYYSPPSIVNEVGDASISGGNVLGRWRRSLASGSDFQLLAYYDRASRRDLNFAEDRDTFDVDFVHRVPWRRHGITWGLGARFSGSHPEQVVPTVEWIPNDFTDKLYTFFAQDEIDLVPARLRLTLGSKFLHNNYTGFEVQPTARMSWMTSERQSLWGGVTRAVRTPSRVDEHLQFTALFFPALPAFLRLAGDNGVRSEYMMGYEGGYRSLLGNDLFLDVAVFYNSYDDLLSVEPQEFVVEAEPPPPHLLLPVLFRNRVMGSTGGFEIAPVWTAASWLRLKGAYSYLHLDFETEPGSGDQSTVAQIEGSSPGHQIVAQSLMELPRELELDFTYRFVSDLPYRMADAYHTADLRLSWSASESLVLSFVGRNLFDANHVEFTSDPGPNVGIRRSFYANVTFRN
jgi:iron complex outermembrane receptor protein